MKTDVLFVHNPWWTENNVPNALVKPYKRKVFQTLLNWLEKERILGIIGPRRAGKTTLTYQLIDHLIRVEKTSPKNILYVSLDDPAFSGFDFEKLLEFYELEVLRKELRKEKTYVFLDEVQFFDDWALWLKRFHDLKYPVKFVVSGSSAIGIKRKSRESLVGRIIEEKISSFSFKEFLECAKGIEFGVSLEKMLKGNFSGLDKAELASKEKRIKLAFNEYSVKGGFPEYFAENEFLVWSKMMRSDVIDKTLYKDLVKVYDIKMPVLLEKLLVYLASNSSNILNHSKASEILGLSRVSVINYLAYLKAAFLIDEAKNYGGSAAKRERSLRKVYVTDVGVRNSLVNEDRITDANKGMIMETLAFNHLKDLGEDVYYWRNKNEVDLVLKKNGLLTPIEVKYQDQVNPEDLKGIEEFVEKYGSERGVVVTKNLFEERNKVTLIPLWLFLLSE